MHDEKIYAAHLQPPPYQPRQSLKLPFLRRRRARFAILIAAAATAVFLVLLHNDNISELSTTPKEQGLFLKGIVECRSRISQKQPFGGPTPRKNNPRWNSVTGQNSTIVLQNATLFDGASILNDAVNIVFENGLIVDVSKDRDNALYQDGARVYNLEGRFVTPGLVDIHSHHLEMPFAHVSANQDVNEKPHLGPITPFVRAIDGFKPYDPAISIIASGGVTTSLNLPGSGNIIGGQAYLIKNLPNPGESAEPVVEDLLLDHGLPLEKRQRYMKMACGENPKYRYEHTRLGNAWLLRQHLAKALEFKTEQDAWCEKAEYIQRDSFSTHRAKDFVANHGHFPVSLELEATVALLRGEFNVNIHCYEPEDLERMLDVLHEFGVHPNAFHHALEAWQVPELLKQEEGNITVATFAENALYKYEAYGANLRGPKILDDHNIRVVLKSDHTGEGNFAKYLLDQASVSHSYGLSEVKALQAVTSAAAHSIQQNHRVGYVRVGFDADVVVWDSHPLSVGATPLQVFVDGREVLDPERLSQTTASAVEDSEVTAPRLHSIASKGYKHQVCTEALSLPGDVVFTGITDVLLDHEPFNNTVSTSEWTLVVSNGDVQCFDRSSVCLPPRSSSSTIFNLTNGYVTPSLLAFGNNIGVLDISSEPSTGDGASLSSKVLDETNIPFAKYGIHFGSRSFDRARLGGVTRAVTAPLHSGGVLRGVSVGLRTNQNATTINGGIWRDEVALHVHIGQDAKGQDTPTISSGIQKLHQIFSLPTHAVDGVYACAANGSLPVIVHTVHPNDIEQVILLKRSFPKVNFVIYGGHGAPLVAPALAEAGIPVILTGNRGAPDIWEKQHTLPGPPLSPAAAELLINAGVLVALAVKGDSKTHGLAREARFAGKWAGLSDREAIKLVSTNFDKILGLEYDHLKDSKGARNLVLWDGNPLRGEGSVVISITDEGEVGDCLPDVEGAVL